LYDIGITIRRRIMDKELYKPIEEKMKKTINVLKDNLANIRAGRANPSILDRLNIDYYGAPTPINQVATVSVPEARVILIQPWEAKLLKDIEKEIQKSDIGINPNNDGKVIRLVFPALTEERRKELTKTAKKEGEEAKVAIRSIRRDSIEVMKTKKKNTEITEDDLKDAEKDIQNLTDKYIADIDHIVEAKDKEIMEV
jgi:ribosome recycling factor